MGSLNFNFPARLRKSLQDRLQESLHETFGIEALRPGQDAVIASVMQQRDTLAVMPTGAGKSLCFQLPALHMAGTTVVVSPLISLMQDQVQKLEEVGVEAALVNSTLSLREQAEAIESVREAESRIVFTTPEQLADPGFVDSLRPSRVTLFVIDEAHCISKWGHDFRPAYLGLKDVIRALGEPTVLALTATATAEVVEDIQSQLGRPHMQVINTGIYRANLQFEVLQVTSEEEKMTQLASLLHALNAQGAQGQAGSSGIVYAATVKAVEAITEALQDSGLDFIHYHGRLPARQRQENQQAFMDSEKRIMIATNAFGMGIDKPDIRYVIHFQTPGTLEAYYQEAGRAGRDGEESRCILLYHTADKRIQQFFLARHTPDADDLQQVIHALREQGGDSLDALYALLPEVSQKRLQLIVALLEDGGLLRQEGRPRRLRMRGGEIARDELERLAAIYREKDEHDRAALERMVGYAQSGFCRWKLLLDYFNDAAAVDHCGHCDNCLRAPEQLLAPVHEGAPAPAPVEAPAPKRRRPLEIGETVRVAKYGSGTVEEVAGDQVTIVFPDQSRRSFLRSFVKRVSAPLMSS